MNLLRQRATDDATLTEYLVRRASKERSRLLRLNLFDRLLSYSSSLFALIFIFLSFSERIFEI